MSGLSKYSTIFVIVYIYMSITPKRQLHSSGLNGVISQKMEHSTNTTVAT